MAFFDRVRKGEPADDRHADGKFKLGPVNEQKKRGSTAFETAKSHLDDAQAAALNGDAESSQFHVGMAAQYANVGLQNHLMSDYLKATKKSADERVKKAMDPDA